MRRALMVRAAASTGLTVLAGAAAIWLYVAYRL